MSAVRFLVAAFTPNAASCETGLPRSSASADTWYASAMRLALSAAMQGRSDGDTTMPDNETRCGHAACQCTVSSGEQYCSDFCREAAGTDRVEGPFCECGHAACASNRAGGEGGG